MFHDLFVVSKINLKSFQESHRWKEDISVLETASLYVSSGWSFGIFHINHHHGETWTCLSWFGPELRSSS